MDKNNERQLSKRDEHKLKKKMKKQMTVEDFEPYFGFLDDIEDNSELIFKIFEVSSLKKPLKVRFKSIEPDKVNGFPYLIEDIKHLIILYTDKGLAEYPVYNPKDVYPVYKKSNLLPPNGLKYVKGIANHKPLGVVEVVLKESTAMPNDADTKHLRENDGVKVENYFIFDFETELWKQVDKKDFELQDRLNRIKQLDILFETTLAELHTYTVKYSNAYFHKTTPKEFLEAAKTVYEHLKCALNSLYAFLHYGLINEYQFRYLKQYTKFLMEKVEQIDVDYRKRYELYLKNTPESRQTMRYIITDNIQGIDDNEYYSVLLPKLINSIQTKLTLFLSLKEHKSLIKTFLKDKEKFESNPTNYISSESVGYLGFYPNIIGNAREFVPTISFLNFKTSRTAVSIKKDELHKLIQIIESLDFPNKKEE